MDELCELVKGRLNAIVCHTAVPAAVRSAVQRSFNDLLAAACELRDAACSCDSGEANAAADNFREALERLERTLIEESSKVVSADK